MKLKNHPAFWMALATTVIGTLGVAYKIALDYFDPVLATGLRTVASAAAVAIITWHFAHKPFGKMTSLHIIINGLMHAGASALFIVGLSQTQALNYSMLGLLTPVFIFVGSIIFLHDSFNKRGMIGSAISLFGGLLLVGAPALQGDGLDVSQGDLMVLLGCIVLAGMVLHTKTLYKELAPHQVLSYRMLTSGAVLLTASFFSGESFDVSGVPARGWIALAYASVVVGAIALMLFYGSLNYMKAEDSAAFFYLDPLSGVLASAIFLGDRLEETALIAGSVIVFGILISHPTHMHRLHFYHTHPHKESILNRFLTAGKRIAHVK